MFFLLVSGLFLGLFSFGPYALNANAIHLTKAIRMCTEPGTKRTAPCHIYICVDIPQEVFSAACATYTNMRNHEIVLPQSIMGFRDMVDLMPHYSALVLPRRIMARCRMVTDGKVDEKDWVVVEFSSELEGTLLLEWLQTYEPSKIIFPDGHNNTMFKRVNDMADTTLELKGHLMGHNLLDFLITEQLLAIHDFDILQYSKLTEMPYDVYTKRAFRTGSQTQRLNFYDVWTDITYRIMIGGHFDPFHIVERMSDSYNKLIIAHYIDELTISGKTIIPGDTMKLIPRLHYEPQWVIMCMLGKIHAADNTATPLLWCQRTGFATTVHAHTSSDCDIRRTNIAANMPPIMLDGREYMVTQMIARTEGLFYSVNIWQIKAIGASLR